ncbi:hypothetical protein TWF718_000532 [Orbilia javanica]|uniref:Uncharacterized protein n=1 Tax=Orbilia javanica TaxID=47235 RepID=A0AAN8RGH1_9PEZI
MNTTSSPTRYPTAPPSGSFDNRPSSPDSQWPSQEGASENHTRTTWTNHPASPSAGKSKGEKVLDNSIKAANWVIWGDIGGKEERERKKREKKEKKERKKEGKDDGTEEKKKKKEDPLKQKRRDDDGVEHDWLMELLQAIA